jgi:hypothetical protein
MPTSAEVLRARYLDLGWIALTVVLLTLCLFRAAAIGYLTLSPRYSLYAIPVVLSEMRGRPHDYTAYIEIAAQFGQHPEEAVTANIDKALALQLANPEATWLISGDDKGLVDLVYPAFRLFGSTPRSIFYLWALVLCVSAGLYVTHFIRSPAAMAALTSVLASFYVVLFTFGISDQSANVIEPRFIGFLGILPLLQLLLAVSGGSRLTVLELVLLTGQAAVLTLVVHIRSSEIWQPFLVALALIVAAVLRRPIRRGAVVVMVLAGLLAFTSVFRHLHYNRQYLESDVPTRVFWHNALMGLAASPALGERYGLRVLDDLSVTEAVRRFLGDSGKRELQAAIFKKPDYVSGNFQGFPWAPYEAAARSFYWTIARNNRFEFAKVYLVSMPKVFLANVSFMAGHEIESSYLFARGNILPIAPRLERDLFLSPLRLTAVASVLMAGLLLFLSARPWTGERPLIALGLIGIGSAVPPFIVMPVLQYIQVPVLLLLTAAYFGGALCVASLLLKLLPDQSGRGPGRAVR